MLIRKTLALLCLLLALVAPVLAQEEPQQGIPVPAQEEPDEGLLDLNLEELLNMEVIQVTIPGAHWHWEGDWMVGYQYMQQNWVGHLEGSRRVSDREVLSKFPLTHERMRMDMHMLMFMYGDNDDLTYMIMVPYMEMDMPHLSRTGSTFTTRSEGLGDISVSAILPVFDDYPHRLQVEAGISAPTGRIDMEDLNGRPGRLEYAMQLGSGTFDLKPALTYLGQTEDLTWGAQLRGTVRLGQNAAGYRRGHELGLTAWISPALSKSFSPSLRIDAMKWGNVHGIDPKIAITNPASVATLQSGERIDLLLGLNYAVGINEEGHGHRFSIEGGMPIYQHLRGPQLRSDWRIGGAWQWTF